MKCWFPIYIYFIWSGILDLDIFYYFFGRYFGFTFNRKFRMFWETPKSPDIFRTECSKNMYIFWISLKRSTKWYPFEWILKKPAELLIAWTINFSLFSRDKYTDCIHRYLGHFASIVFLPLSVLYGNINVYIFS